MAFKKVATLDQIWKNEKLAVSINQKKILLVNIEDTIYAYEDRCAHQAVPMSNGLLEGSVLTCSAHEWQYDARTGKGINPTGIALQSFPVKVDGNSILIDVGP